MATIERLVREGAVGRVLAVKAVFSFALTDLTNVRALPDLDGGALMDVGCYCVSGARVVAGEPVSVLAEQVVGETGVDMALYGTLRFPDDVVAQIEASFLAPERQSLEVVGDGGVLRASAPWRVATSRSPCAAACSASAQSTSVHWPARLTIGRNRRSSELRPS